MHYPWTAFSRNGKPTIEARRRLRGKTPYVKLSDDDVLQVNKMYKCPGKTQLELLKSGELLIPLSAFSTEYIRCDAQIAKTTQLYDFIATWCLAHN